MIGVIVLGLFLAGVVIWVRSITGQDRGTAENRMGAAFLGGFGIILMGVAVLIALGAGLWNLF